MVDCQCHGNLGFSGFQFLIGIVVTHANILSSKRSTRPRGSSFTADWNALLPLADFIEEANEFITRLDVGYAPTGNVHPNKSSDWSR